MKALEVSVDESSIGNNNNQKKPFFRRKKYLFADTICGCCCCCATVVPLLFFFFMFIIAWAQTFPATKFTNVKYDVDGTTLHAYLATPANPTKNTPAAILFHAWNGMSEEVTYFADRLAEEGYYAIAPDLFRNTATTGTNILWNILTVLTVSETRMDADSDAAFKYLKSIQDVDETRISSGPGFCFGGSQSLKFAARHKLAATVTCYGTYIRELQDADAAAWGKLKEGGGPILGIYGMDDTSPSPEQAKKFEEALVKNKLKHNITIYEGVGHAFIQPGYHKDSQSKGHATAVKAWNQITRFLKDAFNTNSSSTGSNRRALSVVPYVVPFHISLYHKMQCALKCSEDYFTHTGHWTQHHDKQERSNIRTMRAKKNPAEN